MGKREKLSEEAVGAFVAAHPGWDGHVDPSGESGARVLPRTFAFDSYAAGIAFVVRLGFAAEARDHHPNPRRRLAQGPGRVVDPRRRRHHGRRRRDGRADGRARAIDAVGGRPALSSEPPPRRGSAAGLGGGHPTPPALPRPRRRRARRPARAGRRSPCTSEEALTHPSFANEQRGRCADNQRLEFLGDASWACSWGSS